MSGALLRVSAALVLAALVSACAPMPWHRVQVQLPESTASLPPGDGSAVANSQCLVCHSAGMILTQPKLTEKQWTDTINKMRNVYGAPLSADQVAPLVAYFVQLQTSREQEGGAAPGGG